MKSQSLPLLRLPTMGPLTRTAMLYDFSPDASALPTIDWETEAQVLVDQRLASVAQRVMHDLELLPPDHIARQFQDAVFAWTQASCIASKKATDDLVALHDARIPFVVTKGPGIAQLARQFSERPFTDIDILVPGESLDRVLSILGKLGYAEEEKNLLPRPALGSVCREAVNLRSQSGGSLDVHHRIPPWYWGSGIRFDEVRDRATVIVVPGGGELPCASTTDNLLISALHIVSDKNSPGSNLMAWRDVLLLAHNAQPDDVIERARATRLSGWIQWVMGALPSQTLPTRLVETFADQDPRIPGRFRLAMVVPPGIASRHIVLSQVFRLPVANAAKYLAGLSWPSDAFLRSRVGDANNPRIAWWRGAFRERDQLHS